MNFWQKLARPFFVLAPMADVTDAAFRRIIAKYGGPDVMYTEFVSADGLCHPKGREKLLIDLEYDESERPIVAQLFTAHPEKMEEAAKLVTELGFDGLDINMGCPDRSVEKQGAGAALIKNPPLARQLIQAARRGVSSVASAKGDGPPIPISVKTRLGYNRDELETWLPELLAERPAAITIHARTRKEMSKVPARWERIKRAVEIRNELQPNRAASQLGGRTSKLVERTLIVGNGDVGNLIAAAWQAAETGADGIMLGRAIFGNPWLFEQYRPSLSERLQVLVEHTKLFEQIFAGHKSFAIMKKHFKAYFSGTNGAGDLRQELMAAIDAAAVERAVHKYLAQI